MMIDYNKAFITSPDGQDFQVLDENGNFDGPATQAEYEKNVKTVEQSTGEDADNDKHQ